MKTANIFALAPFLLASHVQAFFRLACFNPVTIERADPIVAPGKVAGHTHIVSGGSGFSPSASAADLRASNCSSCGIQQDMSAYWTPYLYFQFANGTVQSVNTQDGGGVYYRIISDPADQGAPTAFPDGFRMISGSTTNRDPTTIGANRIRFTCILSTNNDLTITSSANLPSTDCPGGLMTVIVAPSCWDGVNVDSPSHQSHVSWPLATGACPTAFPVRLPTLTYTMTYYVSQFLPYRSLALNTSQPFVFSNGDPTGYGYHFDFANGWTDLTVLQAAINQCTATVVESCAPLTLYSTPHYCHRTPDINEVVTGTLPGGLPGNNPIVYGPASAPILAATSTPAFISNAVAYARAPPPNATVFGITPRVVLTSGNWTYQTCYAWNSVSLPALSHVLSPASKTVESCLSACQGYAYCGVGNAGASCTGGNHLSAIGAPVDFNSCGIFCTDAPTELCGDYSGVMELYERAVPPPVILPSHNSWTYQACYTNWVQGVGLLSRSVNVLANKTMAFCLDQCDTQGFNYCGMSTGGTCYGGISLQSPNVVADVSTCDLPCAGDSTVLCGGITNLLVYSRPASTTILQTAGNYTYSTCYGTTGTSGVASMSTKLVSPVDTVESCMAQCQKSGFLYCGVQNYGYVCWGSNTLAAGSAAVTYGSCATACYSAPLEWCGGTGAIGLYTLTGGSSSSSSTRSSVTFSSTTTRASSALTTTRLATTTTVSTKVATSPTSKSTTAMTVTRTTTSVNPTSTTTTAVKTATTKALSTTTKTTTVSTISTTNPVVKTASLSTSSGTCPPASTVTVTFTVSSCPSSSASK